MLAKVVLVEPQYGGNVGLICRAMGNFGISGLVLVNPKADVLGNDAKARAMHARGILEGAKIVGSLETALRGVNYAAATTSKITKDASLNRTPLSAGEFAEKFKNSDAEVALVFGREDSGLKNSEIKMCDFIVHIPSSRKYKSMNISHAAAILFYELFSADGGGNFRSADAETKNILIGKFREFIGERGHIKNREKLLASFKALVGRALVSEKEALALMSAFETGGFKSEKKHIKNEGNLKY